MPHGIMTKAHTTHSLDFLDFVFQLVAVGLTGSHESFLIEVKLVHNIL